MSTEQPSKQSTQENTKVSFMRKVRIVFITVLVLVLGSFVLQNYNHVKIELMVWSFQIRIVVIILVSAIIGALITLLLLKNKLSRKK
jgi:uncharacterized integral membrane protein